MKHSEEMWTQAVTRALSQKAAGGSAERVEFDFTTPVRWLPTGAQGFFQEEAQRIQAPKSDLMFWKNDNNLFYSLGGATMRVRGSTGKYTVNRKEIRAINVRADVTISDTYDFADVGWARWRLLNKSYGAANYLQLTFPNKYKSFDHSVKFEATVEDFRVIR